MIRGLHPRLQICCPSGAVSFAHNSMFGETIFSHVEQALEERHFCSTKNDTLTKAPEERHIYDNSKRTCRPSGALFLNLNMIRGLHPRLQICCPSGAVSLPI